MEESTETQVPPWHTALEESTHKVFRKHSPPVSEFDIRQVNEVKARANWLYTILECQPDSREIALAKTKLEEAVLWAEKAIRG